MKNKRFIDAQIMLILEQAENGVPVAELCREHGMSSASFYKWRVKFGGEGCFDVRPDEGHGRREPAAEADVFRVEHAE